MSTVIGWQWYARNGNECAPEWAWAWDGLVGLWAPAIGPTGNALFDLSGRGNTGILTNMVPAEDWVGGPNGWALDFDGDADRVAVAHNPSLIMGTGDWTVATLARIDADGTQVLVDKRNVSSPYTGWAIATRNFDKVGVELSSASTRYALEAAVGSSSSWIPAGEWHAYVGVFRRASNFEWWRDGVLVGTIDISSAVASNVQGTNELKIGGHHVDNASWVLDGQMASIGCWSRAWVRSEITTWSADPFGLLRPAQQSPAWWYSPGTPPASSIAAIHDYYRRLRCA